MTMGLRDQQQQRRRRIPDAGVLTRFMWRKCTKCSFPPLYLLTFVPKLHCAAILTIVRNFNCGGIILGIKLMGVDDVAAAPVYHEEPIACHIAISQATGLAFRPGNAIAAAKRGFHEPEALLKQIEYGAP